MKNHIAVPIAIALAIAVVLPLPSQAQIFTEQQSGQIARNQQQARAVAQGEADQSTEPEAESTKKKTIWGAIKGGGIGCVAGGVFGLLRHQSALKDCLVAGAAGAVIGGVVAYHKQVEQAKQVAEAAKAAGGSADYTTKTVEAKSSDGSQQQTQALDTLTVNLDAEQVDRHDANTEAVLNQAASIAKSSPNPVAITLYGTGEQREWMTHQIRAEDPHVQINSIYAASPKLVLVA